MALATSAWRDSRARSLRIPLSSSATNGAIRVVRIARRCSAGNPLICYLAPELNRTIERVLYIHGRAIANFVCAPAEHSIRPNDRREDFIPHWPALYPNAPQCRDLAADDAAALMAFYDSLHALADFVNGWWEREGQLPVNIFNSILHYADRSLRLGLICVAQLEVEKVCPPPYEAWGTISSRIQRSLTAAAGALKQHIARYEAKAQAVNKAPSPPQGRNCR
jgi:hypothetical protein